MNITSDGVSDVLPSKRQTISILSTPASDYFPGLDTLRAFAIVIVMIFHAGNMIEAPGFYKVSRFGWIGVDLFFVLSGFLIGSQLFQSQKRHGQVMFANFYFKRALRILPSFFVVLGLCFVLPGFRDKPILAPA